MSKVTELAFALQCFTYVLQGPNNTSTALRVCVDPFPQPVIQKVEKAPRPKVVKTKKKKWRVTTRCGRKKAVWHGKKYRCR